MIVGFARVNELFQLDLRTFVWKRVDENGKLPKGRIFASFTALDESNFFSLVDLMMMNGHLITIDLIITS